MPDCTPHLFHFPSFERRKIEVSFTGGNVTSAGGILLLRAADRRLGLVAALNGVLTDPRDPLFITHPQVDLLRQRIYGLALGYEDLNAHDTLRGDLLWQTALERSDELASSPTLCRLEKRANLGAAQHSLSILKLLVKGLRQAWPPVKILLRGDSGFCRWRLFSWCERHGVDYLVGLAKNVRLAALAQPLIEQAEAAFVAS